MEDWRHSLWSQEDEADTTHSTPDVNGGYSRSLELQDLKLFWHERRVETQMTDARVIPEAL